MPLIGSGLLSAGSAPAFVGAYDGISNLAAVYSVRRVLTSYTGPLLRLRRDSDNAESDFGYVAATGDLDTAAIATWLGGATGYVTTWYDQLDGIDYIQATAGNQPFFNAAESNGKPSVDFPSGRGLTASPWGQSIGYQFLAFAYNKTDAGNYNEMGYFCDRWSIGGIRFDHTSGSGVYLSDAGEFTYADGAVRVNGTLTSTFSAAHIATFTKGSSAGNLLSGEFGRKATTTYLYNAYGYLQEFVAVNAVPSAADHNTIGASMASYYGLTWNTIA